MQAVLDYFDWVAYGDVECAADAYADPEEFQKISTREKPAKPSFWSVLHTTNNNMLRCSKARSEKERRRGVHKSQLFLRPARMRV